MAIFMVKYSNICLNIPNALLSYSNNYDFQKPIHFETYQDHRMAMCLAPLSLKWTNVTIENPSVVQKSYRSFWDDFATTGLTLKLQ